MIQLECLDHSPVSFLPFSGTVGHCHPEHRLHSLGCLTAICQTCPVSLILSNLNEGVLQEIPEKEVYLYPFPIVIHSSLNPIP